MKPGTDIWNDLLPHVSDLPDRRILEQVQFCIHGLSRPCGEAGQYFVADFVFVKYKNNLVTGVLEVDDIIIADSKLKLLTNLTQGQAAAKAGVGGNLNIRSLNIDNDIYGIRLPSINQQTLSKSGNSLNNSKFLKIHGDELGNGSYLPGGIKN